MVAPAPDTPSRRKRPKTPGFSENKQKPSPPVRRDHLEFVDTGSVPADKKNASLKSLGKEERVIIREEKPELRKVLEEFRDRAREVKDKVAALAVRAEDEAREDLGPREEGAAFLAAKQMLLMSYCRDLCSYASAKARGDTLNGGGSSGRLVELRTVMEKLRPMDRKLKYQTDKLLRLATANSDEGGNEAVDEGGDGDQDPLSFRPRPEALAPWGDEAGDERVVDGVRGERHASTSQAGDGGESGLYRAPRLASVPYDEEGGAGVAKGQRRLEKRRDKLRRGEVMETLREEFGDQPETVRAVGNAGASGVSDTKMKRILEEDKDRLDFEEDHMVRLTVTRKAKKARAQMEKDAGRLETIADVGSAADFVRVARDAGGFGAEMEGGEDDIFAGGRGKKSRGGGGSALDRAMGAVGGGGGGGGQGRKGKKRGRK